MRQWKLEFFLFVNDGWHQVEKEREEQKRCYDDQQCCSSIEGESETQQQVLNGQEHRQLPQVFVLVWNPHFE